MITTTKETLIKSSDAKLNTEPFDTISSEKLVKLISIEEIEASSFENSEEYISLSFETFSVHQLIGALNTAFDQHKSICLSPDHFWLMICQGFAEHIKVNSKRFKSLFVGNNDKETITIQRDDFILGERNPWENTIPEFSENVNNKIGGELYSKINLKFSTTTAASTIAFQLSFMDSMSDYFDFESMTLCGIPEIKLLGTTEDYQKIRASISFLKQYDLEWWLTSVDGHLQKIINSIEGKVDKVFWSSIFKVNNNSGGPYVTGWITDFFPYLSKVVVEENGEMHKNLIDKEDIIKVLKTEKFDHSGLTFKSVLVKNLKLTGNPEYKFKLDDFPTGITKLPFKWDYLGRKLNMNFISGFLGVKQDSNHFLKTEINWIVEREKGQF